ncbi:MAG: ABC transporter permease [Firmicutes bacterium]|nr:ABC transporter permease [Bacillota bacterium]
MNKLTEKKPRRFGSITLNISFLSAIMAVCAGLLLGLLVLLFTNASQAFPAFKTILFTPITGGRRQLGQVLYFATPLICTGLSVGFAFKTGLFNIGASGQFTLGAYAAIVTGVYCGFFGGVHWAVCLLVAALAGALWGSIPGLLKAYYNVNEVITSIMLNYTSMYIVNYLIVKTCYNQLKNQSANVLESALIPKFGLNKLFPGSSVGGGIIIAVLAAIAIYVLLEKTTFGYELKAVGLSRDAAKYAGINEKRGIVLSMAISGALSGLGGGLVYLAGAGKNLTVVEVLLMEGMDGISVALLGLSHPIGVLFAGLFFGWITVGGFNMQLYSFAPEIVDVISSTIIYFAACSLLFRGIIESMRGGKKQGAAVATATPAPTAPPDTAPAADSEAKEKGGAL